MQTSPHVDVATERSADPLRVACATCTHSEFIHGDRGARRCLYSECACASFRGPMPTDPREPAGRRRTGPRTRSAGVFAHR